MTNTGWNYAIEVRSYNAQQPQRAQQPATPQPQPAVQFHTEEATQRAAQSAQLSPDDSRALDTLRSFPRAVFDHAQAQIRAGMTHQEIMQVVDQTVKAAQDIKEHIVATRGQDMPIVPGYENVARAILMDERSRMVQQNQDPLLQVAAMEQARYNELEARRRLNNLHPAPSATHPMSAGISYEPVQSGGLGDMLQHAFDNVPTFSAKGPDRGGQGVA